MKNLATKAIVKLHDHKIQRDLKRDEEGLTMLAYALGAAVIIVPLAIAVFEFGIATVGKAEAEVNSALAGAAGP